MGCSTKGVGVRFTPGHGREPAGSLSCRTITQQSERGTAVHSLRHAILLGSAPPPAQGALGDRYVEEAFAGVWNGVTKANIRMSYHRMYACQTCHRNARSEKLPRTADGASEELRSAH
jgi:hypothetical protein